jgi:acetyl-CoA carboxylase biotin carboxylase subunit
MTQRYHEHRHSIECRINAEDPADNFRPSPGIVTSYRWAGPACASTVSFPGLHLFRRHDSPIGKLITWGRHAQKRQQDAGGARRDAHRGVTTTIPFHKKLLRPALVEGRMYTRYIEAFAPVAA